MKFRHILASLALADLMACAPQPTTSQERDIERFLERFVRTVNEADVDAFLACFSEDATAFFPSAGNAALKRGLGELREAITPTFERGPPTTRVEPRNLSIDVDGNSATVTFEAGASATIARRSLILRRSAERWMIVHLHASNVAVQN